MEKKPKLSVLPVSLYSQVYSGELSMPQWSKIGAELGLNAVDIHTNFMKGMTLDQIDAVRQQMALPVLMASTYSDFTILDPELRAKEVELAKENIRKCQAIGASYIRLTAGQAYPECKVHDAIDHVYDCFEQCVVEGEKCGVKIVIENHSQPGAWKYPDFNYHPTRVLRLWEKLESLPIGVNFDTANAFALDCWTDILHAMLPRIETVHINDVDCVDPLHFCVVGEGVACIENMLRILLAHDFDGWFSIEEAGFQGIDGMKRAIANTHQLYQAALPKDKK